MTLSFTPSVESEFGATGTDGAAIKINVGGDIRMVLDPLAYENPSKIQFFDGTDNYALIQGSHGATSRGLFIGPGVGVTDLQIYIGLSSSGWDFRPSVVGIMARTSMLLYTDDASGSIQIRAKGAGQTITIRSDYQSINVVGPSVLITPTSNNSGHLWLGIQSITWDDIDVYSSSISLHSTKLSFFDVAAPQTKTTVAVIPAVHDPASAYYYKINEIIGALKSYGLI